MNCIAPNDYIKLILISISTLIDLYANKDELIQLMDRTKFI